MKLDYCFHTHTSRCGHAFGEDENYVIEAINAGIKVLGFSDHVFLPGIEQKRIRGAFELLEEYVNTIKSFKKKYKKQVDIYIGFECENFDSYLDYYKELKEKRGFDYLILGQHFYQNEDGVISCFGPDPLKDYVDIYISEIEKAMKSGLFLYFAHPDFILSYFRYFDTFAEKVSHKICALAKQYNIPLEINLNGMVRNSDIHLTYPIEDFWKIVGEEGNEVVIGYDSHYPEFFRETIYKEKAFDWISKYNLNTLTKEDLLNKIKRH